jgi:hypothetical protein
MFWGPASKLLAVTGRDPKSDTGPVSNCSGSTIVDFENVIEDCDFLKSYIIIYQNVPILSSALHKIVFCSKFN